MDKVVGKAIAIQVRKRRGRAKRGYPRGNAREAGMHLADRFEGRMVRQVVEGNFFKAEACYKFGPLGGGKLWQARKIVTEPDQGKSSGAANILLHAFHAFSSLPTAEGVPRP